MPLRTCRSSIQYVVVLASPKQEIHEMLKLETPNLHEIGLDRVVAYGHT
jgi:hypothetical protein